MIKKLYKMRKIKIKIKYIEKKLFNESFTKNNVKIQLFKQVKSEKCLIQPKKSWIIPAISS